MIWHASPFWKRRFTLSQVGKAVRRFCRPSQCINHYIDIPYELVCDACGSSRPTPRPTPTTHISIYAAAWARVRDVRVFKAVVLGGSWQEFRSCILTPSYAQANNSPRSGSASSASCITPSSELTDRSTSVSCPSSLSRSPPRRLPLGMGCGWSTLILDSVSLGGDD